MNKNGTDKPKLRLIDARPIEYEGATYLMLRDPLALSEKNLLIPQPMIPLLALCDGTRTIGALRGAMALRFGIYLQPHRIEELLGALDDALLLDNENFHAARSALQVQYRQADFRPPANAGLTYPSDPQELSRYLQAYLDAHGRSSKTGRNASQPAGVRGIISPHIDYQRGGPVYARVWSQAAEAVRGADLAIIFGTDHFNEGFAFSLTRQNYATPYGVLPTAVDIVDSLAQVIGPEAAYQGELHHIHEHSIELAAVWMHHMRGGEPIQTVPVLTGSVDSQDSAFDDPTLEVFLSVLRQAMAGRRVIVVAAGDLAHIGPAFDTPPVDPGMLVQLKTADDALIEAMCQGNAAVFLQSIRTVQNQNNVCGVSPIYLTLRLLDPVEGENLGYAACPADENLTSYVSICGVTLQ